jgi:hypothetical protein
MSGYPSSPRCGPDTARTLARKALFASMRGSRALLRLLKGRIRERVCLMLRMLRARRMTAFSARAGASHPHNQYFHLLHTQRTVDLLAQRRVLVRIAPLGLTSHLVGGPGFSGAKCNDAVRKPIAVSACQRLGHRMRPFRPTACCRTLSLLEKLSPNGKCVAGCVVKPSGAHWWCPGLAARLCLPTILYQAHKACPVALPPALM